MGLYREYMVRASKEGGGAEQGQSRGLRLHMCACGVGKLGVRRRPSIWCVRERERGGAEPGA